MFIRFALPSLLADGNLPSLRGILDTVYVIHTSRADARTIRAAPVFQALARTVRVEIVTDPDRVLGSPIETHTRIWQTAVKAAKQANGFLGVVAPDIVWADGALATVGRLIQSGKKALYGAFIRVVSETFLDELPRHQAHANGAAAIAPRRLIELILRHMHPMECAYLRDSRQFPYHAEHLLWPVSDEGFVMRCLANQVLVFHAGEYAVNRQFSVAAVKDPSDLAFLTDSDAFAGASLTPLMKDADWYFEQQTAQPEAVGAWWLDYDAPAHDDLARQSFRFHAGDMTERAWRAVAGQSGFFVTQASIAREMIRIGRALRRAGCRGVAELLATALYAARWRRRWHWSGPVTVFAPNDAAFAGLSPERHRALLSAGAERALIDFLQAHVVLGTFAGSAGQEHDRSLTTVGGQTLSLEQTPSGLRINGHAVLERHELTNGHVICVIDGLLAR